MRYLLTLSFIVVLRGIVIAQTYPGQSEVSASCGLISLQQILSGDIIGSGSGGTFVKGYTANAFLTYRYYLSRRVAVGATIGKQQFSTTTTDQSTLLSASDYNYTTVSAEVSCNYINWKIIRLYTYLGPGWSFYSVRRNEYSYNSSTARFSQSNDFNMQYVPVGLSMCTRLSFFIELGFGYKGLVNAGLSYRIGKEKKRPFELNNDSNREVLILPNDITLGNHSQYLGKVSSSNVDKGGHLSFDNQLKQVEAKVRNRGGNVFKVKRIINIRHKEKYKIIGTAYGTDSLEKMRQEIKNEKIKTIAGSGAHVILYLPDNIPLGKTMLYLNDSSFGRVRGHMCKYIYTVHHDGRCKISDDRGNVVFLDLKAGSDYYVRLSIKRNHRMIGNLGELRLIDGVQGELESSILKEIRSRQPQKQNSL